MIGARDLPSKSCAERRRGEIKQGDCAGKQRLAPIRESVARRRRQRKI
jgi:hypothetical protein